MRSMRPAGARSLVLGILFMAWLGTAPAATADTTIGASLPAADASGFAPTRRLVRRTNAPYLDDHGRVGVAVAIGRERGAARHLPASDDELRLRSCRCPWQGTEWRISVPVWVPGVTGTFASGGVTVDSERGLEDVLDKFTDVTSGLEFAFVGGVSGRWGRWGFAVDVFGMSLDNTLSLKIGQALATGTISAVIGRAYARYRWKDTFVDLGFLGRRRFSSEAYAGARAYWLKVDAQAVGGALTARDSDFWVDLMLGMNANLHLTRKLALQAEGDVGGFGVGSELAWWLSARLDYRFTSWFSMSLGYQWLDIDYRGDRGLDVDIRLSGPTLALNFWF